MKLNYKVGDTMSVKDMHYGTHFSDGGRKPRNMIKLQDKLPSGLTCRWTNFLSGENYPEKECARDYINAVDYNGVPCTCPDFVKFKVTRLPNFLE